MAKTIVSWNGGGRGCKSKSKITFKLDNLAKLLEITKEWQLFFGLRAGGDSLPLFLMFKATTKNLKTVGLDLISHWTSFCRFLPIITK